MPIDSKDVDNLVLAKAFLEWFRVNDPETILKVASIIDIKDDNEEFQDLAKKFGEHPDKLKMVVSKLASSKDNKNKALAGKLKEKFGLYTDDPNNLYIFFLFEYIRAFTNCPQMYKYPNSFELTEEDEIFSDNLKIIEYEIESETYFKNSEENFIGKVKIKWLEIIETNTTGQKYIVRMIEEILLGNENALFIQLKKTIPTIKPYVELKIDKIKGFYDELLLGVDCSILNFGDFVNYCATKILMNYNISIKEQSKRKKIEERDNDSLSAKKIISNYLIVLKEVEPPVIGLVNNYLLGDKRKSVFFLFYSLLVKHNILKPIKNEALAGIFSELIDNLSITERTLYRKKPTEPIDKAYRTMMEALILDKKRSGYS